jgi:hypothetical protein
MDRLFSAQWSPLSLKWWPHNVSLRGPRHRTTRPGLGIAPPNA